MATQQKTPSAKSRTPERTSQPPGNAQKEPSQWKTGDEPMTGAQASYLKTLCDEAGVDFDEKLSKAQASEKIDELRGSHVIEKRQDVSANADASNTQKSPEDWKTGDEPMTGAQASYLKTLCDEAHVEFDEKLNKAQASGKIEELQAKTGRGK